MTSAPGRVQLRRLRGWRLPFDAVRVDRATRWGNPFRCDDNPAVAVDAFRAWIAGNDVAASRIAASGGARIVGPVGPTARNRLRDSLPSLRGRRLACWCAPESPCHADVLLELANADAEAAPG